MTGIGAARASVTIPPIVRRSEITILKRPTKSRNLEVEPIFNPKRKRRGGLLHVFSVCVIEEKEGENRDYFSVFMLPSDGLQTTRSPVTLHSNGIVTEAGSSLPPNAPLYVTVI